MPSLASPQELAMAGEVPSLLIVVGKNIGADSDSDVIRQTPDHLSEASRFNAEAAGELWQPGTDILFSGGHTAGANVESEAEAMKRHLVEKYPHIPLANILTEEVSIDTAGNAKEVAEILDERFKKRIDQRHYQHIGLVTVGYHLKNAAQLFHNFDVPVEYGYASENVLRGLSAELERRVEDWEDSPGAAGDRRNEVIRKAMLPFDTRGRLLRVLTRFQRK